MNGWVGALNASSACGDVLVGFANTQEDATSIVGVFTGGGLWEQDERAAQTTQLCDTASTACRTRAGS